MLNPAGPAGISRVELVGPGWKGFPAVSYQRLLVLGRTGERIGLDMRKMMHKACQPHGSAAAFPWQAAWGPVGACGGWRLSLPLIICISKTKGRLAHVGMHSDLHFYNVLHLDTHSEYHPCWATTSLSGYSTLKPNLEI